jgi:hypothetical protein
VKLKNRLTDLNDHLFAQIERLADENLTPEQVDKEAKRGKAIVAAADRIIKNAALQVQAAKLLSEKGTIRPHLPAALGVAEPVPPKLIAGQRQ